MQVFDSNGPDVRIRGTAHQICEKYLGLAKDSAASGDNIMAQNYLQHAEHYQRIINEWQDAKDARDARDARNNHDNGQQQQQQQQEADGNKKDQGEDLGLPQSITGESAGSDKKVEKNLEDA